MTQTITLTPESFEVTRCTRVMLITPEVAASWLLRNTLNRPLVNIYVAELANAMVRGEWRENGESIKFAASGTLIDGQHRLAAIVRSGCGIWTAVAFGLDESIFDTLDRAKKRKFSDSLAIMGVHSYSAAAAAVGWLWRYNRNEIFTRSNRTATPPQLMAEFETIAGLPLSLHAADRCKRLGGSVGMMAALHYLFAQRSREHADEFFELLATGINMDKKHPVLALRERLNDDRAAKAKLPKEELFVLIIRAWNAFVTNRPVVTLRGTTEGAKIVPLIHGPILPDDAS